MSFKNNSIEQEFVRNANEKAKTDNKFKEKVKLLQQTILNQRAAAASDNYLS